MENTDPNRSVDNDNLFYSTHSPRLNNPPASMTERIPELSLVQWGLAAETLAQQLSGCHLGESSTGPTQSLNDANPSYSSGGVQPSLFQDPRVVGYHDSLIMNQGFEANHGMQTCHPSVHGYNVPLNSGYYATHDPFVSHNTHYRGPNPLCGCSSCEVKNYNRARGMKPRTTNLQEGNLMDEARLQAQHEGVRDSTSTSNSQRTLLVDVLCNRDPIEMMKDKHANYLFQQFMDICNEQDKAAVVLKITQDPKRLVEAAKDEYGCKSVKKLITSVKTSSQLLGYVTSALSEGMLDLMTHSRGPEMLLYCFRNLEPAENSFIFEAALKDFNELARDKKGSILLQHCILHSRYPFRQLLLYQVIENSFQLALDIYGNYVVQFVVHDLNEPEATEKICMAIIEHFEVLSQNKFGSYVVQRCLQSTAGGLLLQALLNCNIQTLERLIKDSHGNYVIQTAMKVQKDSAIHGELIRKITGLSNDLRCHPNARNVLKPI